MEDYPLRELNGMEVSKLTDIEFKRMVLRMFKELTDNHKELSENKAERKHLHQTSTARNAKQTAIRKGKKRVRERNTLH